METTTNKILERGFLDAVCASYFPLLSNIASDEKFQPPNAYYTLYPRNPDATTSSRRATTSATATGIKPAAPKDSLIARYKLEDRIAEASPSEPILEEEIGGKAVWEPTPEKREASLQERKAKMVLAARQCALPFHSLVLTF